MNILLIIKCSYVDVMRPGLRLGAWWPEGRSSSSVSQFCHQCFRKRFARWQWNKETVTGVIWVLDDFSSSAFAAFDVDPHHSSPSVNILRRQTLKTNLSRYFNFKPCFWLKYETIITLPSSEKSDLVWIRRELCTDQAPFTSRNSSELISGGILMWEITGDGLLSLEEALL